MKKIWLMAFIGALILAGCSSSGGTRTIEVVAQNMSFDKTEITVQQGEQFELVLNNQDEVEHEFVIDEIPGEMVMPEGEGHEEMAGDLHTHAHANSEASVKFTPSQAGEYEFYCGIEGHKESGMVGTLIVE